MLDDYQQVAATYADWDALGADEVTFFAEHLGDADGVVAALEPYDVVVAMRERTAFPADVLARLREPPAAGDDGPGQRRDRRRRGSRPRHHRVGHRRA